MLYKKLTAAVLSLLLGIAALGTMSAGAADLGDINGDGAANASDAARILIEAARIGSTGKGNFTSAQKTAGDVNSDGKVNASDASKLLIYSASVGAGAFAGTLQSYMSSYYTWNWKNGSCKLTLPPEWKGKYVISGNTVYCKACYDADKGSGELFSLVCYSVDEMSTPVPKRYLLGVCGSGYVNAILPTGVVYDLLDQKQDDAYRAMEPFVENVLNSAVCSSSPDFSPIYISAGYGQDGPYKGAVAGCWEQIPVSGAQFDPTVVFNYNEGKFLYHYTLTSGQIGSYFISTGGPGSALAFIDNDVYRVDTWGGAPHTMNFTNLTRPSRSFQGLAGKTFGYLNDWQSLSIENDYD